MSVVTIGIGQCGIQLSTSFYESLSKCNQDAPFWKMDNDRDVDAKKIANSVLIDMEPKVIQESMEKGLKSTWSFSDAFYCKQSGSANNWAFGYNTHGPREVENIMDIVRKTAEGTEYLRGFLSMMSLAGGTGSGLGTFINECLREEFPKLSLVNQLVWPFQTGEVIVQNYNSILSLAHLTEVSDMLILTENDELHQICQRLLNIKKVSFGDMNRVLANTLLNTLLPAKNSNGNAHLFDDGIQHLCSHPMLKMISVKSIPQIPSTSVPYSTYYWPAIIKRLYQMVVSRSKIEEGINWQADIEDVSWRIKMASNLLILRGENDGNQDVSPFTNTNLYSKCTYSSGLQLWKQNHPYNMYEKTATLLSNSEISITPLKSITKRAFEMFSSKAYLHQYEAHKITPSDFEDCFVKLEDIISNYKSLS